MDILCAQFGISRQAYYQKRQREGQRQEQAASILELVRQVRARQLAGSVVAHRAGPLRGDVQVQAAAQRRVEHLDAPANAQDGLRLLHRPARQRKLQLIPLFVHAVHGRMRFAPEARRRNVAAAGH